jgi:transmembrane sensor
LGVRPFSNVLAVMEIKRDLIKRFLQNQATADEAEYIAACLKENPDLLDDLLPGEEWEDIKDPVLFSEDKSRQILNHIREQLRLNKSSRNQYWWIGTAASLLILLSLGILMNRRITPVEQKTVIVYNLVKINYGKEDIPLRIEDGSFILLKEGSEIQYPEHFTGKDRTFYLKGEARFKVAKDRKRPFNVHAGGTVTTALGTDFTIVAPASAVLTKIVLHEGKVVVKAEDPQRYARFKNVYLNAGEEVSLNRTSYLAVRSHTDKKVTKLALRLPGTTAISATSISFKNQSLRNIYKMLDREFSVRIRYKDKEIADRYFTGSFKRDSLALDQILQETALLNQLHLVKRDSIYYLNAIKNKPQ